MSRLGQVPATKGQAVPGASPVKWRQPKIAKGDTILFCRSPGGEEAVGYVTDVGEITVSGSFFIPGTKAIGYFQGARHCADPSLESMPPRDGIWRYSEQTKLIYALAAKMLALETEEE